MRKGLKIFLYIIPILLLIGWYYWGEVVNINAQKDYVIFYHSDLNGIIEKVGIRNRGSSFKLKGMDKKFVFYPNTNFQLNNSKIFHNLASEGDIIIKPSQSDTLILIKGNQKYLYTFQRIN